MIPGGPNDVTALEEFFDAFKRDLHTKLQLTSRANQSNTVLRVIAREIRAEGGEAHLETLLQILQRVAFGQPPNSERLEALDWIAAAGKRYVAWYPLARKDEPSEGTDAP